jgi:hypothetical protein
MSEGVLVIQVLRVKSCPYCGEDHGEMDFYPLGKDKAGAICPTTVQMIVAERE